MADKERIPGGDNRTLTPEDQETVNGGVIFVTYVVRCKNCKSRYDSGRYQKCPNCGCEETT